MTTRAERLTALLDATKKWAAAERKRLQDQVALNEKLLKGRGGNKLAQEAVDSTSALTVEELETFLSE